MLSFHRLTDTSTPEFREAMEIYNLSFPPNERVSPELIKRAVDRDWHHLIVGTQDGKTVFMALFFPLRNTNFILFDYMATAPEYRGQGIATAFINEEIISLKRIGKYLLMEVEDPRFGENKIDRQRRINLYQHLGAKILKDVPYILPALSGDNPNETVNMILMILPAPEENSMDGALVEKLIRQVFSELYRRSPDDPLLNSFINDIPERVELI